VVRTDEEGSLLENLAAPQVSAFRSARVAPTDLEGRSFLQKKIKIKNSFCIAILGTVV
jgi:hypothetical protein